MIDPQYAVVWIDHREAKIFRSDERHSPGIDVNAHTSLQNLHHNRGGWEAGGNAPDDTPFFRRVTDVLDKTRNTLITGPGNAKNALKTYLDNAWPKNTTRVFTTDETSHQPDEDTMLALGRRYFDRMVQLNQR